IELTCKDTAGRTITQSEYLNYYEDLYYSSESLYYRFANQKVESASNSAYQYYSGYTATYALGERVGIQLLENSLEPVDAQGNTLYTLVQDGILDSGVVPATSFSFTQNERYLPNLTVVGAYFDGRHIYPVSSCSVLYDPAEHELSLSVTPDRNTYRPGDKVSLDVAVTDASGAPVSTDISVSVVDEAVFALAGQNIDPLGTLYQSVYSYTLAAFTSYNQYAFDRFNDGGGKGGGGGGMETGGGDMPRGQFKDTAAVLSATTDQDGRAALSFTLPDNLTSWRITGVTVTDDLCAGTARTNINTTIPLFVSPVYNTTYVEGDDIAFTARAYGDKVTNDTEVAFTTTVTTGKRKKEEQTLTLPAGEFAQFDFGKLAAGDYTVLFGAQADGESDAVEHSFTVKKSALEMPLSRGVTQGEVSGLRAEKYPVWLGFYDSQYAEYIQTLEHLAGQYGSRADQQTAYAVAAGLLKQFADDDEILTTLQSSDAITADFADYQRSSGGVCLHSYDYPDVQLTARAAVAAPELFNTETMVSYLDEVVNTGWYELTNTCAAIMGLAALRQPVLTDAKAMLKNASALSDIGILYLTLALAYLGDTDGARAAYDTYIAPHIVTGEQWSYYDVPAVSDDGEIIYTEDGSVMKADTGKGDYDRFDDALTLTGAKLERTALVMLLAQQTGLADTDALLRYVRDNSSYDVSTLSEQTAYVNHFVPAYTDTAVVSYNRGLFPTTLELKKGGIRYIPFNKNQLAKSNVTVKNGDVGILASYTGTPDSLAKDPSTEITVSKSIRKQDAGPLNAGDLALVSITVTFGGDAPTGQYDIAEWVPSSLRFQSAFYPGYGTNGIWLDSQEGQRLTMSLYYSGNDTIPTDGPPTQNNTYTIAYYARCVTDGDSRVDSTYVIHRPSGAMNFTEQATLSLGDAFKPIDLTSK
ncbi:MAG: alpha-2-macroglobulin family protein, partial [Acetanaerobacterium sp.]